MKRNMAAAKQCAETYANIFGPDLMIVVDGIQAAKRGLTTDAVERQLKAMFMGQVATQVRESAARVTDVRVRYPNNDRFGRTSFDRERVLSQWLLLDAAAATGSAPAATPLNR